MTSFIQALIQKLLRDLRLRRPGLRRRRFSLDEEAAGFLRVIAAEEQRGEDEVAAELLSGAIRQRYHADSRLEPWLLLTRRERQAVALACAGYTNTQIAHKMKIGEQTVKSQLHSAERKFGVTTKRQLRERLADWDFSGWEQDSTA